MRAGEAGRPKQARLKSVAFTHWQHGASDGVSGGHPSSCRGWEGNSACRVMSYTQSREQRAWTQVVPGEMGEVHRFKGSSMRQNQQTC